MNSELSIGISFLAGLLSFFSPCSLPLYPSFLSYITGITVDEVKQGKIVFQSKPLLHTLFFILGFSIIFIALGLSTSFIGELFSNKKELIRQLGGILLFVIGLTMLNVFNFDWLKKTWTVNLKNRPIGYVGSMLVGVTYAAAWTPCVGPLLSSIIVLGISNPSDAFLYTVTYTIGFSIPFFIMTFFVSKISSITKYTSVFMKVGGGIICLFGLLLYFDKLTLLLQILRIPQTSWM
ncbi:cytochrome c biogenesis CcdA family protein [Brevibacillus agri]|uniref:cytochrome c biogenesis CcdA family protein n=1 Tax=Brevibacillus agri TaxID=51101 RepID=UPI0018CD899A|nr:cytochrome c biogenesis protein CcdA [Brevibacillus agri]MBG9565986.1 cytochrome C biogenesis protein CcdA [Brevibacillus agri]